MTKHLGSLAVVALVLACGQAADAQNIVCSYPGFSVNAPAGNNQAGSTPLTMTVFASGASQAFTETFVVTFTNITSGASLTTEVSVSFTASRNGWYVGSAPSGQTVSYPAGNGNAKFTVSVAPKDTGYTGTYSYQSNYIK